MFPAENKEDQRTQAEDNDGGAALMDGMQQNANEDKDKLIRLHVEQFFKQTNTDKWVEICMGVISLVTSLSFVILTYWDQSEFDPCCQAKNPHCNPACDRFYNIRMPYPYQIVDKVICVTYLLEYSLNMFISQNRR